MNIYSDEILLAVWAKGNEVPGYDSRIWRQDFAGAWMRYDHFGMKDIYGWQIDHRCPRAKGGADDIENLYPLQWENNLEKSDDYPYFSTKITSRGNGNIEERQAWQILSNRK